MHWLSFFIGALLGWLVGWLIDILICRPRRKATEAELRAKLERANKESAALQAQLSGHKDLQVRLDGARRETDALRAQLAGMKDVQAQLNGANAENSSLKAQLAGLAALQGRLTDADRENSSLKVQLAGLAALQGRLADADGEIGSLKAQVAGMAALQGRLADADGEIGSLKAQVAGTRVLEGRLADASGEIASLKAQLAGMGGLQGDLDACHAQAQQDRFEIARLNADLAAARAGAALRGPGAEEAEDQTATRTSEVNIGVPAPVAPPAKPDDLTVVEGIGVKISELLAQNDIRTFAQLAAASVERLRAILDSGGLRFRTANPETWAEQASLAHDGKWDALKALQDSLQGGRRA
jgi:predicted flap endonuclease-1-like 5' DNA nuclease